MGKIDTLFVSPAISNIVDSLSSIINEKTSIISTVNGLPWWYFHKANTGTNLDDTYLESVDPAGKIWKTIKPQQAIGCVVYPACEIIEPGVIKHNEGGIAQGRIHGLQFKGGVFTNLTQDHIDYHDDFDAYSL